MGISQFLIYVLIGCTAGLLAGLFGVGGGIVIVPALIYLLGFSPHTAVGTSIAVLLPPVGIAAFLEYYRRGCVDLKAAILIAISLIIASWLGATLTRKISGNMLRLIFGIFIMLFGLYMVISTISKMKG
ncbi:MAG: sulfite exporter TauE/SafE family protein [Chitinispirillaceae bacterium]|nr:sulfite exporter TauE/SafE family protein [Chitinispirillaceae bacterium]